jgi:kynureninase
VLSAEGLSAAFKPGAEFARQLDAEDALRRFRDGFHIPAGPDGQAAVYLCGNSLGLQPRRVSGLIAQELDDWASQAVEAHFSGRTPWYSYHEIFRDSGARLVGARPGEVVMMNSLTTNLHLMMISFYRPTARRSKILIEHPAFPSDLYAVKSQIRFHGFDPAEALLTVRPREGEELLRTDDILEHIATRAGEIALVLLAGVNFHTGQFLDLAPIAQAARRADCTLGLDLAHAAGNVPLALHDWDVDFAVWCSYKYLNCGPGAVAGCFVHSRHHDRPDLPRLCGWWGHDPATRFRMHLEPEFVPRGGAESWQLSNPPILAMVPLRASLDLFDQAGMRALRGKSELLTGYLHHLLDGLAPRVRVVTPRDPAARGCQLSLVVGRNPAGCFEALRAAGVVCDVRPPDVIRVAPVPLYNTFEDVWRFAQVLDRATAGSC